MSLTGVISSTSSSFSNSINGSTYRAVAAAAAAAVVVVVVVVVVAVVVVAVAVAAVVVVAVGPMLCPIVSSSGSSAKSY